MDEQLINGDRTKGDDGSWKSVSLIDLLQQSQRPASGKGGMPASKESIRQTREGPEDTEKFPLAGQRLPQGLTKSVLASLLREDNPVSPADSPLERPGNVVPEAPLPCPKNEVLPLPPRPEKIFPHNQTGTELSPECLYFPDLFA